MVRFKTSKKQNWKLLLTRWGLDDKCHVYGRSPRRHHRYRHRNILDIYPGYLPRDNKNKQIDSAFNIGLTSMKLINSWRNTVKFVTKSVFKHLPSAKVANWFGALWSLLFLFRAVGDGCTPTRGSIVIFTSHLAWDNIWVFVSFFSQPARFTPIVKPYSVWSSSKNQSPSPWAVFGMSRNAPARERWGELCVTSQKTAAKGTTRTRAQEPKGCLI